MKILWIKTELLHPVDKGGKIRTYNMLKELKPDHHITYLTLDDGLAEADAHRRATEYCHELICVPFKQRKKFSAGFYAELVANFGSSLPYAIKKYVSTELRDEISEQSRNVDVVVCDFLAPSANVSSELNAPVILFQHNVEAMIWKRHYEVAANPFKRLYLYLQWKKMQAFEGRMCRQFNGVVAVSKEDCEQMQKEYGVKNVFEIATGVDVDFFRPTNKEEIQRHNLVFTGSMDWLPNEDAIRFFTEQVMPRIRLEVPDVSLTVVGRDPYASLVALGERDPSIIVTGRVEDVRPFIEHAAVYVVPLRVGGGTRLKIYEAMAMEKAVVSTTVGAEGLPLIDGEEIILADDPKSFADAVVKLLHDSVAAEGMGRRAATRVRSEFGWRRVAQQFADICERTLEQQGELTRTRSDKTTIIGLEQAQEF